MSGEIGASLSKVGGAVGGLAIGAMTGGAALAMRGTVGKIATDVSQSNRFRDWAANNGRLGKFAAKTVGGIGSASFDARATKAGAAAGKGLGVDIGKAKEGGFAKSREEKIKKEEEFAKKSLDTGDYGMAELTSGKISTERSDQIMEQMKKSGSVLETRGGVSSQFGFDKNNNPITEQAFRTKLAFGVDAGTARKIADMQDAVRRTNRADHLEKRGGMTNKIKANKIRKNIASMEESRKFASTIAALAAAQKAAGGGASPAPTAAPKTP